MDESQCKQRRDIVLPTHGTNSQSPSDTGADWWQRESEFWRKLCEKLDPTSSVNRFL
jgi:hypothetical protein